MPVAICMCKFRHKCRVVRVSTTRSPARSFAPLAHVPIYPLLVEEEDGIDWQNVPSDILGIIFPMVACVFEISVTM